MRCLVHPPEPLGAQLPGAGVSLVKPDYAVAARDKILVPIPRLLKNRQHLHPGLEILRVHFQRRRTEKLCFALIMMIIDIPECQRQRYPPQSHNTGHQPVF